MHLEFPVLERPAQPGFHIESAGHARLGFRRVELVVVAALLFRLVHGHVGALQQIFGRLSVARKNCDPDARGDVDFTRCDRKATVELHANPVGDRGDARLGFDAFQENGKLVAAETRDGVLVAHAAADAFGGRAKDLITCVVPEHVVDLLEPIQIDEENRERAAGVPRPGDALAEAMEEEAPVGQPGQHVMICQVKQAQLVFLVSVDVGDRSGEAQGLAALIPDCVAAAAEPPVSAVLALQPEFLVDGDLLLEKAAHRLPHALGVLGMEGDLKPVQRLVRRVPQQLAETGRVVGLVAAQIPVPNALERAAAQQFEPLVFRQAGRNRARRRDFLQERCNIPLQPGRSDHDRRQGVRHEGVRDRRRP